MMLNYDDDDDADADKTGSEIDQNDKLRAEQRGKFWSWLSSRPLIEAQIRLYIFCAHAHLPFETYYNQRYGSHRPEVAGSWFGAQRWLGGDHRVAFAANELEPEAEAQWDWRGIPGQLRLGRWWVCISNANMYFSILKTTLSRELFELAHLLTGWPGHCVIPGRFIVHPTCSPMMALGLSIFHQTWRYVQNSMSRSHSICNFVFLLQTDRDLAHFYSLMRSNEHQIYLLPGKQQQQQQKKQQQVNHQVATSQSSTHELFFRHLMCYEVYLANDQVAYKLRPNRTWQARAQLAHQMSCTSVAISIVFSSLALIVAVALLIACLSDLRYAQTYPGCHAHLDELYTSGQLTSLLSSFTLTGHHLVAFVFDYVENVFLWIDSGFGLTYVVAISYVLHCDIRLYWRHLHARLELDLKRAKQHYCKRQEFALVTGCRHYHHHHHHQQHLNSGGNKHLLRNTPHLPVRCCVSASDWAQLEAERRQLEVELNELRCQIGDFFRQIDGVNSLVSDILTMSVVVWICFWAGLSGYYLARFKSDLPLNVRLIQSLGLLSITLATHYVALPLHRSCLKSYQLICSLMAFDRAIESDHHQSHKKRLAISNQSNQNNLQHNKSTQANNFVKVLEFFTKRQATSYMLFGRIPYRATTYITLIGWSFSSVAVCYALFGTRTQQSSGAGANEAIAGDQLLWPSARYSGLFGPL